MTYKNISKNFNAEDGAFVRSKTGSFHSRQASDADEFFALAVARSYEDDDDDEPLVSSDQPSAVSD